jgi:chromosome partitioning protein
MRRIALVNQKGGVGKTTSAVNLGAALALQGRRVLLVDLDPQANLSTHLGLRVDLDEATSYSVLCRGTKLADAVRPTALPNLYVVPTNLDLSGAELELASALGRENILRDAIEENTREREASGLPAWDFVLFDCPPSLGLLSVNGLVASTEVFIAVQTEFFALQGMSKLREVVALLQRRLNPQLRLTGIIPCLYDTRLRLAREVLAELRRYFPEQVFPRPIHSNIKLAEAPSYGQTIFEYAPESSGARDYRALGAAVLGISEEEAHARELALRPPDAARNAQRPPPRSPPRRRVPGTEELAAAEADGAAEEATAANASVAAVGAAAAPQRGAREEPRLEPLLVPVLEDLPELPPEAFEIDHLD